MNRTERLIALITSLSERKSPTEFKEIQRWFPKDYGEVGEDAAKRKFERDKALLLELGVPISYQKATEDTEGGYFIDRDNLYLPDLELKPEEIATLTTAGALALSKPGFPYRVELERALKKVIVGQKPVVTPGVQVVAPEPRSTSGTDLDLEPIEVLHQALLDHRRVRFNYRARDRALSEPRTVEPYGLACRRGRWYLVGLSQNAGAIRVYAVDRMAEVDQVPGRVPMFEIPENLNLSEHLDIPPWRYQRHPELRVRIAGHPSIAWWLERTLGGSIIMRQTLNERRRGVSEEDSKEDSKKDKEDSKEDWPVFELMVTNRSAFITFVVTLGHRVRVLAPSEFRAEVIRTLLSLVHRHADDDATALVARER